MERDGGMQITTDEFFVMIGQLYVENFKLKQLVTAYRAPLESNNGPIRNQESAAEERSLSHDQARG